MASRRACGITCVLLLLASTRECFTMSESWQPRAQLVEALAASVPDILASQDKATGRFGSQPWICADQNRIFPLAAAWATQARENPYYHSAELLEAIMAGGDALIDAQDEQGKWTFRKKDNSTWGQIHMPWTYSRWIRAFQLIRDAMPPERRRRWEEGLVLGYTGIANTALGRVHNIPCHHAMGLYCAGMVFGREQWRRQATEFMARVVAAQSPDGYWSEHFGPVVRYNFVYSDSLGAYYAMSRDATVLEALRRAAIFHANFTYPDGSAVETVDERNYYHGGVALGNVGFSFTPEGRGYLAHQFALHRSAGRGISEDLAAGLVLHGEEGDIVPMAAARDEYTYVMGDGEALVRRRRPWFICVSAIACEQPQSRWQQDRQNFVSVFHDDTGLILGGGNTKLQPFWSNFTVGDTSLLAHDPADTSPEFAPQGDLIHLPSTARLLPGRESPGVELAYGAESCRVALRPESDDRLMIVCEASARSGKPVEGHITLLPHLGAEMKNASGTTVKLGEETIEWKARDVGGWIEHAGWRLSIPDGARVLWPKHCFNPYAKDGVDSLSSARIVVALPFPSELQRHELTLHIVP